MFIEWLVELMIARPFIFWLSMLAFCLLLIRQGSQMVQEGKEDPIFGKFVTYTGVVLLLVSVTLVITYGLIEFFGVSG